MKYFCTLQSPPLFIRNRTSQLNSHVTAHPLYSYKYAHYLIITGSRHTTLLCKYIKPGSENDSGEIFNNTEISSK